MRDIWAAPPGAAAAGVKRARSWLRPAIASSLVLVLGVGVGSLYASMKASTEVTTEDAVAQFRSDAGANPETQKKKKQADKRDRPTGKKTRKGSGGGAQVAAAAGSGSTSSDAVPTTRSGGDAERRRSQAARQIGPPEDGVYTWRIEGYEQGPGVRRDLPRKSHRIITHDGGNNWTEHHVYSEQKEQWFHLGVSEQGVFGRRVRNRVEMGPVTVDKTVVYNPVMFVQLFPPRAGATWGGEWSGKTHGEYKARVLDHTTLTIEGEKVDVWVAEVVMHMEGEVEGDVLVRSWASLDHRMVVKQYQETDVKSGPGSYYSEWMGEVTSLEPRR